MVAVLSTLLLAFPMPSDPIIDVEALLAPLEGETPAGSPLAFETRQLLEDRRKEIRPEDFPENDPMRPEQSRKADWAGIIELAKETLTTASKDLMVAARLTEALVKEHGFGGLRDGLQLMRRLAVECWDRLYPSIEDGDLEVRATPFNWLDDPDRGARFPSSVLMVTLVQGEEGAFGWLDWRKTQDPSGTLTAEGFEKAVETTDRDTCQRNVDDLQQARSELEQLGQTLNEKLGELAPGLTGIRRSLDDCFALAEQILARKEPPPGESAPVAEFAPVTETSYTDESATSAAPIGYGGTPGSRDDVYRRLAEAADQLQQMEPHSPVPYLIRRAVQFGNLPFPDLMRELVRDANVLTEMNRELGIKEAVPAEAPPSE